MHACGRQPRVSSPGADLDLSEQALDICTDKQRKVLEDNYAKKAAKSEAAVKQVFKDLELEARFKKFEKQRYEELLGLIGGIKGMPTKIFSDLLNRIYRRKK